MIVGDDRKPVGGEDAQVVDAAANAITVAAVVPLLAAPGLVMGDRAAGDGQR